MKTKIGLVQMKMSPSKGKNISKAALLVRKAAGQGAQIVCLPELFSTRYFPQTEKDPVAFRLAEKIPGKTTKTFCALAKKLGIVIILPLYEKSGKDFYNSLAVINENGKILGKYRKMHIPQDPLFYEQDYFKKGDLGFRVFETRFGKIAPLICFDQWFPEAARILALKGADIIFYPTAIGWIKGYHAPDNWLDAWRTIQRAHSIANGIHVAVANRVGDEKKLRFWGNSFITDAFGKVLKTASGKEGVIVQEINLADNERIRDGWGFFRNRRPESYPVQNRGSKKKKEFHRPLPKGIIFPRNGIPTNAFFFPGRTTGFPFRR